jgi:hypothetical protein
MFLYIIFIYSSGVTIIGLENAPGPAALTALILSVQVLPLASPVITIGEATQDGSKSFELQPASKEYW